MDAAGYAAGGAALIVAALVVALVVVARRRRRADCWRFSFRLDAERHRANDPPDRDEPDP